MTIDLAELVRDYDALRHRISAIQSHFDHFAIVSNSDRCVRSESYDDPGRWSMYNKAAPTHAANGTIVHVPDQRATGFRIRAGEMSLACQFHLALPRIENELVSIQWEAKYDPVFQHGGKAFQLDCGNNSLGIELQANKFPRDRGNSSLINNYEILHSVRCYISGPFGGSGSQEQLSTGPKTSRNVQPPLWARIRQIRQGIDNPGHIGEGGRAYFVRPGQWVRYTLSWDLSQSPARLKIWIADENTDPTLIMADPDDPNLGFICESAPARRWIRSLRMPEFNNSSSIAPVDCLTLVRNVVVWRGADVPLGGRPGPMRGT